MNEPLTCENLARIDAELDQKGVFAKAFTRCIEGRVTTVGLRIGVKPKHVVALFGDTVTWCEDRTVVVRRRVGMTAQEWNTIVPVGAHVMAYPGVRPEDPLAADLCRRVKSVTRTPAWELGHGEAVVSVVGYAGGIGLAHVDVVEGGAL